MEGERKVWPTRLECKPFIGKAVYRQSRLQAKPFTGKAVYRQSRLQAKPFTGKAVYRQSCLQAKPFTGKAVYRQSRLQAKPFTLSRADPTRTAFETQLLHKSRSTLLTNLLTYLLTPWSRVLLQKLTGFQLVKKFPAFMEPEASLPHSQVPATSPYPEPARYSPCPYILLPDFPS